MGEQRRTDTTHDVRPKAKYDNEHDEAHRAEEFDAGFASRNLEMREWAHNAVTQGPDGDFKGVGDQDKVMEQVDAAIAAKQGAKLIELIGKMSRETRAAAQTRLQDMAPLLAGAEALRIADMVKADLGATIDAALAAKPPPSQHQMRAYLADTHPFELANAFFAKTSRKVELSKLYPGPASSVYPQVTDKAAFQYLLVVEWHLETTPLTSIAREMLTATEEEMGLRRYALRELGDKAWEWVRAISDTMAIGAAPGVITEYMEDAPADLKDLLAKKEALRASAKPKDTAKEVRDDKREITKQGSVDDIASATKAAGMSMDEQVAWLLAKPGLTIDDVRQAAVAWTTDTGLTAKGLKKLHDRFPDSAPADVFGFVPNELYKLAIKTRSLRPWIVNKAEPIEILRFVTFDPNHITELWNWCVDHKLDEKAWLYKLGVGRDDHLLRRFVIGCPDLNVANYVKVHMLADHVKAGGTELTSAPITDSAYQSQRDTLDADLGGKTKPKQIAADVTALTDEQVNELRHDTVKMKSVLAHTDSDSVMRVIDRVQPQLRDVLNFAPQGLVKGLAEWVGGRPDNQVLEALGQKQSHVRAARLLPPLGPLELFPQLEKDERLLAQVLLRNPDFAIWIIQGSEPIAAMTVLGSAAVAATAIPGLSQTPGSIENLPPAKVMPKAAQEGMTLLASLAKGDLHEALNEKLSQKPMKDPEERESAEDNAHLMKDSATRTLVPALEEALNVDVSSEVLVRICREHAGQLDQLLEHPALLTKLKGVLPMSPELAFPGTWSALLTTAPGRAWAFAQMAPHQILRGCGRDPKQMKAMAKALDANDDTGFEFVLALPRGKGLVAYEKHLLHELARLITNDRVRSRLFGVRFDTRAGDFDEKELERIWTVLERVPEAHISDGFITNVTEFDAGSGAGGVYADRQVKLSDKIVDTQGLPTYDRQGETVMMSRAEAQSSLQLDDAGLEKWVKDGKLRQEDPQGTKFRLIYRQEKDAMTATLLHEVGHAVDDMLGKHSELVFGIAGWQAHTEADFDLWAADLGGWGSVDPDDQKEIREVWMMWLSGSRGDQARESVGDMVPKDHPAVAAKYASVGVVELARKKQMVSRLDPARVNGKAALVSHKQQRWYTMSMQGLHSAPSDYSLTAPSEYFAECYMMYYREYEGTPETADKKGASVAPWIKTWFDKNIDNVGHNPKAKLKPDQG